MTILPSTEQLREWFTYDEERGRLVWKNPRTNRVKIGQEAGCKRPDGYRVVRCNGRRYREHILIWVYNHGEWPSDDIDHINMVRDDNRIENLRRASRSQNMRNTKAHRDNSTGFKGVTFDKCSGKFKAQIGICGRQKNIGRFDTAKEAHAAYARELLRHSPFHGRTE